MGGVKAARNRLSKRQFIRAVREQAARFHRGVWTAYTPVAGKLLTSGGHEQATHIYLDGAVLHGVDDGYTGLWGMTAEI